MPGARMLPKMSAVAAGRATAVTESRISGNGSVGSTLAMNPALPVVPVRYTPDGLKVIADPSRKLENKRSSPSPLNSVRKPVEDWGVPLPWNGAFNGKSGDPVEPLTQTFPDGSTPMFVPISPHEPPRYVRNRGVERPASNFKTNASPVPG